MANKEISFQDIRNIELDILKYFKSICEKYGLQYYLACGTLIGAVRHHGFIPWDDDVDVMMPREDYNRLVEIMRENKHPYYKLVAIDTCPKFTAPLPKIIDTRTKLIQYYDFVERVELGVYIDVFILDGAADDYDTAIKRYQDSFHIYRKWMHADAKLFKPGRSKIYGILRWIKNIPYRIYGIKRYLRDMNSYNERYSFYKSKYVATFNCGFNDASVSVYERESFGEGCQLRFEDEEFCVPNDYDTVLRIGYGNYMDIPPESERKPHHRYIAVYKEK